MPLSPEPTAANQAIQNQVLHAVGRHLNRQAQPGSLEVYAGVHRAVDQAVLGALNRMRD